MAITHSPESDSVEPNGSVFLGDRVVTSFPRHEVVKLDEGTFLQWQQQVRLILRGYGLFGLLDGSLTAPTRFIQSSDGGLIVNPAVSIFDQQDSLLTSWLLSTISSSFLSSFTDVRASHDVWNVANNLFATDSSAKQSQLRHELHSLRKGSLSVRSYVNKITNLCTLLAASRSQISEAERTVVLLAGLSSEFDAIVSSVSLSTGQLTFQRIVDTLLKCEARQVRSAQEVLVATNTVEGPPLQSTDSPFRGGGRSSIRGRACLFRLRVQCQICSRYGHLAQRCYYRYNHDEHSPVDALMVRWEGFAYGFGRDDERIIENGFGQNYGNFVQNWRPGQNWRPFVWPDYEVANGVPRSGPRSSDDPNPYDSGRDFGDMGLQFCNDSLGNAYGKMGLRSYGPSGSTVHEAPWRTKPRACVFSVASSPYDSSQFVGLPPWLPELHASDYSDASVYDSNFNSTDSYVLMPVGSTSWCLDSDATHHVCKNASELHGSTPYTGTSSLLMGNGVSSKISSIRSTNFTTEKKLLHLTNVLCVSSIRRNLLSVSKFATDNNVFFEFHPSYCVIKDIQTQEILMRGQVRDGLYQFSVGSSVLSLSVNNMVVQRSSTADDVFALWHKRLGHPAPNIVKAVLDNCRITLNKSRLNNGPGAVSCEGNLYYISFIDMTSRFTWVYLISHKSQAVECFGQFQKMVFTQFGKCIKKFQSDWGGEFLAFSSVFASQGILHRVSCPHTSEQNGVAERKHRHIVETGLTLLAQANLPMKLWGYAFCSAVHLINQLPTPVLNRQSPYQSLFGCEPTYDHLRVFGCCCFPYLRPFVKHKLEFQSQPSTFLGYSTYHKGYFCLTPDGKVVVSRHVVFDENHFLFPVSSPASDQTSSGNTTYVPIVWSFPTTNTGLPSTPTTGVSLGSHNSESILRDSSANYGASCQNYNLLDVSGTIVRDEAISTIPTEPDPIPPVPPISTINTHGMITRSKVGIFKPKVLCADNVDLEPSSVGEALAHPDWRLAVQAEYDALIAKSTWELYSLPLSRKAIGCKWLFKIKKNPNGTINRRKARLVAKGCSQVPGYDFTGTFSLVVKLTTIRVILYVAVTKGWPLRQVDVNNAFLNGDLADDVFMQQPPGFVQHGSSGEKLVCHLTKALYGLRQTPHAWFDKLKQFLVSTGFILSKSDVSLFVHSSSDYTLYVLVYMDNIVITGSSSDGIDCFVQ
ncbi:hypothetical protein CXB51_028634 [Gossypium anomalum]|uniref:Integrase catalytic domain-containing protein n=1 Tax=Gossypium anomalum TaxID=47600 RepID=A0A8J6CQG7_9ROSI|nr:hypothetical protein CXB51_028634 [Gossypium anomalum]